MRRTEARELLMKMLYQMEAQNDFSPEAKITYIENYLPDQDKTGYFDKTFAAFMANKDAVDALIESHSNGWKLPRIAKVDLAILRLSVTECRFVGDPEIEEASSIDEAVNLAKKYGSENSGRFVNGILGGISRDK